jgi:hypothetical protein
MCSYFNNNIIRLKFFKLKLLENAIFLKNVLYFGIKEINNIEIINK